MTRQINVETLHPQTRMLSDEQIQAIHHSSLDILSQTGIIMKNKRAEALLLEAGRSQDGRADQDTGEPGPKCAADGAQPHPDAHPHRRAQHAVGGGQGILRDRFGYQLHDRPGNRRAPDGAAKRRPGVRALMRWSGEYRFRHVDGRLIGCRTDASLYPWDRSDAQRLGQADCLHRQ